MECEMISTSSCSLVNQAVGFSKNARAWEIDRFQCKLPSCALRIDCQRLTQPLIGFSRTQGNKSWRAFSLHINAEKSSSLQAEGNSGYTDQYLEDPNRDPLGRPLSSDELLALLSDSKREQLTKKLSEANQQNRFLKRECIETWKWDLSHFQRKLHVREEALLKFKKELATMEFEIQASVALADEIAKCGIPPGTRKINGKYIHSHHLSRLEAMHENLKEQIAGVTAAQAKEVSLFWCSMAESVQVMGTFDGWSQGESLSPEYSASFARFSTKLMLRPGRYEIKFLVDGEWQLSAEYPTVGEGLMQNNLLIVE